MSDEDTDPYGLGWTHGYHDLPADCPYAEGTAEYDSYFEGYEQGRLDC